MAATSNCIACAYRVQGVISIAYRCESCGEILDLNHCLQSVEFLKRLPIRRLGTLHSHKSATMSLCSKVLCRREASRL